MGGKVGRVLSTAGLLAGFGCCLLGSSCILGDDSGVGSIDQVLDTKFMAIGTATSVNDDLITVEVASVVPLVDGLPEAALGQGDAVEIPADGLALDSGHEYAIFVSWIDARLVPDAGSLGAPMVAYDLGTETFVVDGPQRRSDNGSSLEVVVDCLAERFTNEIMGNERIDALVELVRQHQESPMGGYPDALVECTIS